jgi:hypothetical protein
MEKGMNMVTARLRKFVDRSNIDAILGASA